MKQCGFGARGQRESDDEQRVRGYYWSGDIDGACRHRAEVKGQRKNESDAVNCRQKRSFQADSAEIAHKHEGDRQSGGADEHHACDGAKRADPPRAQACKEIRRSERKCAECAEQNLVHECIPCCRLIAADQKRERAFADTCAELVSLNRLQNISAWLEVFEYDGEMLQKMHLANE